MAVIANYQSSNRLSHNGKLIQRIRQHLSGGAMGERPTADANAVMLNFLKVDLDMAMTFYRDRGQSK